MNYLTEVTRFYCWLETHPLTPQAQALWNLLMSISNKAGWAPEIVVPTNVLAGKLGVSLTQLQRCRKELVSAGRICHTPRLGGLPPEYRLISMTTISLLKKVV